MTDNQSGIRPSGLRIRLHYHNRKRNGRPAGLFRAVSHERIFFIAILALSGVTTLRAEIKIGAVSCLTGALSTFGVSSIQGARLAIEEINRTGGVLNEPVNLIVEDNASTAGETATIARKFIAQDQVLAILGDLTSSSTMEAAPLAQAAKIPLLTPSATNVAITQVGSYIFRSCFIDQFTGQVMAKFALSHLHAKEAVILTDVKQDYSVGLSVAIRDYFTGSGGRILKEISFSSGDTDFRAQLSATKALHPDVIFLPAYYTESGLILRQARQLALNTTFVGGEGWDSPALVQIAGKSAEGDYYANHFSASDPSPRVQRFVKIYEAKYHATPDALAALWYDGAGLLADAVRRAGAKDSGKIRDALAATRGFEGVTGKISIDENRNAAKPAVILTIENNQPRMVEQIAP